MKKQTILITGAAGFLGSNLSELLLEQGHKIIGVDNCYTGQMSNIERLKSSRRISGTDLIDRDMLLYHMWQSGHFSNSEIGFYSFLVPVHSVAIQAALNVNMGRHMD